MALDFDLACTSRLQIYDTEREVRMFELLGGGLLSRALVQGVDSKQPPKKMKEGTF